MIGSFALLIIILVVTCYVYSALALQSMGNRYGSARPWLAWIPFVNLWLLLEIAEFSPWFLLLFFVPLANFIFGIVIWWKVCENLGRPGWWAILMLIPPLNFILMGIQCKCFQVMSLLIGPRTSPPRCGRRGNRDGDKLLCNTSI